MLTEERNQLLTRVGAGTPMGDLMRRYWHPIAAVSELDANPVKPIRIMGEDLVLYRDRAGALGLLERKCAHRRADLSYGYVEDCGLRCNYHGWRYDERGRCIEQPFEERVDPEAMVWAYSRVPREREPYEQQRIPGWQGPIKDPHTGRWLSSHIMNQDFIAWVGQGTIADRTREHLGASDRGIAMIRRRLLADLEAIARGEQPKALVRDRETNLCIRLPIADRKLFEEGLPREQFIKFHRDRFRMFGAYTYQVGQPDAVKREFEDAIGVTIEECIADGDRR
ncbi:MAG TPA: Rieske 2Fe-2S domain-containing protein [Candidatus Binataceae bacterium]|nr:Rieske 2Fe-2S domain-containing protein [Candidatus Binataceae bacterium]